MAKENSLEVVADKEILTAIGVLRQSAPSEWKILLDFIKKKSEMPGIGYGTDDASIVKIAMLKEGIRQISYVLKGEK